jgi:hypothetical protein
VVGRVADVVVEVPGVRVVGSGGRFEGSFCAADGLVLRSGSVRGRERLGVRGARRGYRAAGWD